MISVALCTYNGEHFLGEQLQSLLIQSMPVDEVVIGDDGSVVTFDTEEVKPHG